MVRFLLRSDFAMTWASFLAIFLCRSVESIRGGASGSRGDVCLDEDLYLNSGVLSSDVQLVPRVAMPHRMAPRGPLALVGSPGFAPGATPRVMHPTPRISQPISQPSQNQGFQYRTVALAGQRGEPTGQMVVVVTDAGGHFVGFPTFQAGNFQNGQVDLSAPPTPNTLLQPRLPPGCHQPGTAAEVASWTHAAIRPGDIAATVHGGWGVEQAVAHGGHVAHAMEQAHPEFIAHAGHMMQHAGILPHVGAAGAAAGGTIAALGAGTAGLSVVVNGYHCYVAHNGIQQAEAWREHMYEGSAGMSQQEWKRINREIDSVVEHEATTFGLGVAGGTGAMVLGTLGVLTFFGTAPAWAPPVALGCAIGAGGAGIIQAGRHIFSEKPDLPETPDSWWRDNAGSLLELFQNNMKPLGLLVGDAINMSSEVPKAKVDLPSKSSSSRSPKLSKGDISAMDQERDVMFEPSKEQKGTVLKTYVKEIVRPLMFEMFARKFRAMPAYIDGVFRDLRGIFGKQVKYIEIQNPAEPGLHLNGPYWLGRLSSADLIHRMQWLDDPVHMKFDTKFDGETIAIDKGRLSPNAQDVFGQKSDIGRFIDEDKAKTLRGVTYSLWLDDKDGDKCMNKPPSPDAYCEERFGPGRCCDVTINRDGSLTGSGNCNACPPYPEESAAERERNWNGVRARLVNEEVVLFEISNKNEFADHWLRIHEKLFPTQTDNQ